MKKMQSLAIGVDEPGCDLEFFALAKLALIGDMGFESEDRMMRRARLIMVVWIAFALMPALAACDPTPQVVIMSPDHQQLAVVKVEIAATNETRELGLMYRNQLDENAGMIFVFPSPENAQFWMKNTIAS